MGLARKFTPGVKKMMGSVATAINVPENGAIGFVSSAGKSWRRSSKPMTPKFEAWATALADRDRLLLNLTIIAASWLSIWILHIRKSERFQRLAWIGVYIVFYATLVYSYLAYRSGA